MWYNPLVTWLLKSSLSRLMDRSTLLLTYTGRRSRASYTFPISYVQHGSCLRLITRQQKSWWKSVAPGAPFSLWLRGQARTGNARVVALAPEARLNAILGVYPGIPHRPARQQVPDAVVVYIHLDPAVPQARPA